MPTGNRRRPWPADATEALETAHILRAVRGRGGWRGSVIRFAALVLMGALVTAIASVSTGSAADAQRADAPKPNPPRGSIRFATTGDNSEIRRAVPIARHKWTKKRVVMSLGPGALPTFHRHDILRTSAEVQVTTTCVDFGTPRCIGRHYGFSPREDARIVLANRREETGGRDAKVIAETHSLRCHQQRPNRNHHCVLVFRPEPTKIRHPHRLPCRPSTCHLNLVLEADHPHARDGQLVLVGADTPSGTVRRDKGRLNAITLHKHVPPAKRLKTGKRRSRSIPIAPSGKAGRRVVYSQRINHLHKRDVIEASARDLVTISSLPYPSFVGTELILTHGPRAVSPTGVARGAVSSHGHLTEANGFNCTHGPSTYRSPCRTAKAGAARIRHSIARRGHSIALYLNVVCAGKAKRAVPRPSDRMRVLRRGSLVVRRYRAP